MEDGWLYLHTPRRRLCWIPVLYRGRKVEPEGWNLTGVVSWRNRVAFITEEVGGPWSLRILSYQNLPCNFWIKKAPEVLNRLHVTRLNKQICTRRFLSRFSINTGILHTT